MERIYLQYISVMEGSVERRILFRPLKDFARSDYPIYMCNSIFRCKVIVHKESNHRQQSEGKLSASSSILVLTHPAMIISTFTSSLHLGALLTLSTWLFLLFGGIIFVRLES